MAQISPADHLASFASLINNYEHRAGHVTRAVAGHLLPLIKDRYPPNPVILDNACGTGAMTDHLTKALPGKLQIYAADSMPAMIEAFKAIMNTNAKWQKSVFDVSVIDSQDLRCYKDNVFDVDRHYEFRNLFLA